MIILASGSPRRRELLSGITKNFKIVVPDVREISDEDVYSMVKENAALKGRFIKEDCDLVIACDTTVFYDGKVYGKPGTAENAVKMLRELCGHFHTVVSGVYLKYSGKEEIFAVESKVKLKKLTESEIMDYVRTDLPLDKAGAYGIQDGKIAETYEGDYNNIIGLPLDRIREVVEKLGL